MIIIDSQVHIWAPETPEKPYAKGDASTPHRAVPLGEILVGAYLFKSSFALRALGQAALVVLAVTEAESCCRPLPVDSKPVSSSSVELATAAWDRAFF